MGANVILNRRVLAVSNEGLAADAFVTANDITSEMQYRTLAVRY